MKQNASTAQARLRRSSTAAAADAVGCGGAPRPPTGPPFRLALTVQALIWNEIENSGYMPGISLIYDRLVHMTRIYRVDTWYMIKRVFRVYTRYIPVTYFFKKKVYIPGIIPRIYQVYSFRVHNF